MQSPSAVRVHMDTRFYSILEGLSDLLWTATVYLLVQNSFLENTDG